MFTPRLAVGLSPPPNTKEMWQQLLRSPWTRPPLRGISMSPRRTQPTECRQLIFLLIFHTDLKPILSAIEHLKLFQGRKSWSVRAPSHNCGDPAKFGRPFVLIQFTLISGRHESSLPLANSIPFLLSFSSLPSGSASISLGPKGVLNGFAILQT